MAGKTGSAQVRDVSRALRDSGHFNSANLPWEYRPNALFVAYAPYDAPRYAMSVVVEHGNAGAEAAAPIARDLMMADAARDPAGRSQPPTAAGPSVAEADAGRRQRARHRRAEAHAMMPQRLWRERSLDLTAKFLQVNWLYVLLLCALAGVGYVALYSAGGGAAPVCHAARHALRRRAGADAGHRHGGHPPDPAAGLAALRRLRLALLVAVARFGHVGKGAQRWIDIGGLQMQPSELMKIALVLALASWFHRASWERMGNPLFLVPPMIATLVPVGADPEGAEPGNRGDHRHARRRRCSSPPACAGGNSPWWRCRSR